jgi:hypothetical protein
MNSGNVSEIYLELRHDVVPPHLSPATFFGVIVNCVLDNCPINFHVEARKRRREAAEPGASISGPKLTCLFHKITH